MRPLAHFSLLVIACGFSSSGTAQIRDDLSQEQQYLGGDIDEAIAESERNGERDSKERRELLLQTDKWLDCARGYANVDRGSGKTWIKQEKALEAVLSCVEERHRVRQLAKAYSLVNGTPAVAEQKSLSIEHALRGKLAKRLYDEFLWEHNQAAENARDK